MRQIALVSEHQLSEIQRMIGVLSLRQISKRLPMNYGSVWLVSKGRYKTNRERHFSKEFKESVVSYYKNTGRYHETSRKFNISQGTVRLWVKEMVGERGYFNVNELPCWITGWSIELVTGTKRKLVA